MKGFKPHLARASAERLGRMGNGASVEQPVRGDCVSLRATTPARPAPSTGYQTNMLGES
ncbi:hypothetical protein [uncultured Roseovarius sp.]|uniref:hypothetical protein n=1 Tax=uncultured Roseovarius sp. TaxID=293344 RepID=UPI00261AB305|nr:hypothetical protein [uncultured Roseovarius sp.]